MSLGCKKSSDVAIHYMSWELVPTEPAESTVPISQDVKMREK